MRAIAQSSRAGPAIQVQKVTRMLLKLRITPIAPGVEASPRAPPKTFLFVSVEEGSMPSGPSAAPAASAAFVSPFELGCLVTAKDEDESPAHHPGPARAGASTPT